MFRCIGIGTDQTYYLAHTWEDSLSNNYRSVRAETAFNPNTCRWTFEPSTNINTAARFYPLTQDYPPGTASGNTRIAPSLSTSSTGGNAFRGATYSFATPLYYGGDVLYASYNPTTKIWTLDHNTEPINYTYGYEVTTSNFSFLGLAATLSGDETISTLGSYSYSYDYAFEEMTCTDYLFNSEHHYWYADEDHSDRPTDWSNDITASWSLSSNAAPYATVNPSTGELTVTAIPAGDMVVTLACSFTDGVNLHSVRKEITLKGMYLLMDSEGRIVKREGISTSMVGTTSFTPEGTLWTTIPYLSSSSQPRRYYKAKTDDFHCYLSLGGWSNNVATTPALAITENPGTNEGCGGFSEGEIRIQNTYTIFWEATESRWKLVRNPETLPSNRVKPYGVTYSAGNYTALSAMLSGNTVVTEAGDYPYTLSTATTQQPYELYQYNNTSHFWYERCDHNAAPENWGNMASTSWSIDANGADVTIDAATGQLTVNTMPHTDTEVVITCTIADDSSPSHTITLSHNVLLKSSTALANVLTIDDREDHSWSYYAGTDIEGYNERYRGTLYSPQPRDVKITYLGNGGAVSSANVYPYTDTEENFVYYKTLEQGSVEGEYPYPLIPNPFSKRPVIGGKVQGFDGWKIVSGGRYIKGYDNGETLPLELCQNLANSLTLVNLPAGTGESMMAQIVLEAQWTDATVVYLDSNDAAFTFNAASGGNPDGTYETNLLVIRRANFNYNITAQLPVTIMQVEPDGSVDYRINLDQPGDSNTTFSGSLIPANGQMTKMEYVKWGVMLNYISFGGESVHLGRGIIRPLTMTIYGVNTNTDPLNQTIRIESGKFINIIPLPSGTLGIDIQRLDIVLGCDYDRAKGNNDNLEVSKSFTLATGTVSESNSAAQAMGEDKVHIVVKSGKHQTQQPVNTGQASHQSFYISNPGYSTGTRDLLIEGGLMRHVAGGACNNTAFMDKVFTKIRIKGGKFLGCVFGGAARVTNNGSIKVVITGGQFNSWVAGAANGTNSVGNAEDGATKGRTYVYVGGNAHIGALTEDEDIRIDASKSGNVFGAGCGNSESSSGGQIKYGSNVVVADNAYIRRGIYGGGAYAQSTSIANIFILNGEIAGEEGEVYPKDNIESGGADNSITVSGGVYGGAALKGGGSSNILMKNGIVHHGIYGGSNHAGEMTGEAIVTLTGGTLEGNVYGGGKGGKIVNASNQTEVVSPGTIMTGNVTINIGGTALVKQNVHGGSEEGILQSNAVVNIGGHCVVEGSVFAGGKGAYKADHTALDDGKHLGDVQGNASINMSGGWVKHCLFGGCELSNVIGDATITMSDGMVGTLRSAIEIEHDATNCHVFGAGKGDRDNTFNTWTNVNNATVNISGGTVYGSVYGGGEEGHALGDTRVNISGSETMIGTFGFTGFDGNVFGGGRGRQSESVTAGSIFGNAYVTIEDGTVLGSVFGGGRMGSVGIDGQGQVIADEGEDTHGHTFVTVSGGTIGNPNNTSRVGGNVYGGGRGMVGNEFLDYAFVKTTQVTVGGNAIVTGSVFGGGEDGHVGSYAYPGSTEVLVKDNSQVGTPGVSNEFKGNVYGGGRGIDRAANGKPSKTAGRVYGDTKVTISGNSNVYQYVFGGGNQSNVSGRKVVNIVSGTVHKDVYGGSNSIPPEWTLLHPGLKTVNIYGGRVNNVYGCSHCTTDGSYRMFDNENREVVVNPSDYKYYYSGTNTVYEGDINALRREPLDDVTAYVNISGGEIHGSVHGAGQAGLVYGSVMVYLGKNAIYNAPFNTELTSSALRNVDRDNYGVHSASKLFVTGSVYGGADWYQSENLPSSWSDFNVTAYSNIYIDGTGYNMDAVDDNATMAQLPEDCMLIKGNIYGSGTHCESGAKGRNVTVRNYGNRITSTEPGQEGWFKRSTRHMATIQRCGNLLIDNSNFTFTGARSIGDKTDGRIYSVVKVDSCFYVANASGLTLGPSEVPADMDSIRMMRSVHLISGSVYDQKFPSKLPWEWIGIRERDQHANKLYYISEENDENQLQYNEENVLVFVEDAKLYVRYTAGNQGNRYGELNGFFRMIGDQYRPWGYESFAYARPKWTTKNSGASGASSELNKGDGGFMSYNNSYNFYIWNTNEPTLSGDDGGIDHTKTNQYPYTNVPLANPTRDAIAESDSPDYRLWVTNDEFKGKRWYVDGTRGWGQDNVGGSSDDGWGLTPDKPKLSITGTGGIYSGTYNNGSLVTFNPEEDVIYVVGPIKASLETGASLPTGVSADKLNGNEDCHLKLYRYPGGHEMSNGNTDPTNKPFGQQAPQATETTGIGVGPGANYGALLTVDNTSANPLTLNKVLMDGLYGNTGLDFTYLEINPTYYTQENVKRPLIVTQANSVLKLNAGTRLNRGYNGNEPDYYTNGNFTSNGMPLGGAIYVDENASVSFEGLVKAMGNLQKVAGKAEPIESNVFLPTFGAHVNISGELSAGTRIGITSPVKNADDNYVLNTFSPVATVTTAGNQTTIARTAWENDNFQDDLNWFFGSGTDGDLNNHTTYFAHKGDTIHHYQSPYPFNLNPDRTLFFGWTWNNVVRSEPTGFAYNSINSSDDLAWLISLVNGLNGQPASTLSGTTILQTEDIDLSKYIWLPIGSEKSENKPFSGTYDGRGHLITGLKIDYIGTGDRLYERNNYGLFGNLENGTVNRTFVVDGHIHPVGKSNIGGLAGWVDGANSLISNSEAAVEIIGEDLFQRNAIGGLVGHFPGGNIHSSMAMPSIKAKIGYVGGLVGFTGHIDNSGQLDVSVKNCFANIDLNLSTGSGTNIDVIAGGLVGYNGTGIVENNYIMKRGKFSGVTSGNFGTLTHTNTRSVVNCYDYTDPNNIWFIYNAEQATFSGCNNYTSTIDSDKLGYMYSDNIIEGDTTLTARLNLNTLALNHENVSGSPYAYWARPALQEINGDMPVLLLEEFDRQTHYQGSFRSVSTYNRDVALQYGGPVRDDDELITMLGRHESVFAYGDITEDLSLAAVNADKVSVYEHAAILHPGALKNFANTFVGISFDNSSSKAYSSVGINAGLYGGESLHLSRDWHMFSSPLNNAPLGFDYLGTNVLVAEQTNYNDVSNNPIGFFNNIWESQSTEFNWIEGQNGYKRYWMKAYSESDQTTDGYFPTSIDGTAVVQNNNLFVLGSDECPESGKYRYPYGMDFYTWTEPDYHWINFKRNGPNHWHSDENSNGHHDHLDYVPAQGMPANVNETELIVGRGYMAAIATPTFMQSHGKMNAGDELGIALTKTGSSKLPGWNLIGNPYHAYLDFSAFAEYTPNATILSKDEDNHPFYVVYDADGYTDHPRSAFLYYPVTGSQGGTYAGQFLHPHQGFYVKAEKTDKIKFTESMTTTRAALNPLNPNYDGHFRDKEPVYPLVNLYLDSDHGCSDVTVIEFDRPEWGGATKLKELCMGNGVFYAQHNDRHYAALFAKKGVDRVPLWFEAKETDNFTIRWKTANADFHEMWLVDNMTGVKCDMIENESYTFQGRMGDYPSRFYITFRLTDVKESDTLAESVPFAYYNGSEWVINSESPATLQVVDVLGRVLRNTVCSEGTNTVSTDNLAQGLYLFRLIMGNEVRVQKVIVNR